MKTTRCSIILLICLCLGQLYAQTHDSIRVAYFGLWTNDSIPSGFYERTRANGFNYVLVEFALSDSAWSGGRYDMTKVNSRLRKQLKDVFLAADQKGLKLIPLFQTSSQHSRHWDNIGNNAIQWQELPLNVLANNTAERNKAKRITPTFAPDLLNENGFDTSFNELLKVIYIAFEDARSSSPWSLSYPNLDYIHVGADEPIFVYKVGNEDRVLVMAGLCQRDRDWLTSAGLGPNTAATPQERVVALLGSNIKRKAQMIRAAGRQRGHVTTALYYTDILDPNHLGGGNPKLCTFTNVFNTVSSNTEFIQTHSLAGNQYIQDIRDSSIAVQWNYDREYAYVDYDTDSTFRYFKNNNLKFLHGSALAESTNPIDAGRLHQLMEQVFVGSKLEYNTHAMGYVAFQWHNIYNSANPAPVFRTMEYLRQVPWMYYIVFHD